ncbi:MAG: NAD(P)/FAD-dependent oxidoreductase, partial [Acidimicrobiia bacterium]|nr:NAD(P)/FAD-dependent oxidoreductase [Acidimicrobiia bacterium]
MSPRVVIVGAGFAGLQAAKRAARLPVEVVVIDRRNHHLFQPLLYQVATAALNPSDIAYPIRRILRRHANVSVVLGEVDDIDLDARDVALTDGERIAYDWLVVATGAGHSYFDHPEWELDAPGLKSIEDALEMRRRVLLAFEAAERSADPTERARLLTFVVVGAGPTGVELAGAIVEIATRTLAGDFRHIDPRSARVVLVEGLDRVLAAYPGRLPAKAKAQLERLGVEVRLDTKVTAIDGGGVETSGGTIPAGTVLWAAGVASSS